jgi:hypothetical protein
MFMLKYSSAIAQCINGMYNVSSRGPSTDVRHSRLVVVVV